jgi:hypothetical protein
LATGLVLGIWVWVEIRPEGLIEEPDAVVTTRPADIGLDSDVPVRFDLFTLGRNQIEELNWHEVDHYLVRFGREGFLRERFFRETAGTENVAVRFLRGLLFLGMEEPRQALEEFRQVPPAEVPIAYLYAPWRVFVGSAPAEENPFAPPFYAAAREGHLAPLLQARALAWAGDFSGSLQAWLLTDPADWTSFDLTTFGLLRENEATASEAEMLLIGAWRGGRIPEALQPEFARFLLDLAGFEPEENTDSVTPEQTEELRKLLSEDEQLFQWAIDGLASLQEDRRLFLQEDYAVLLTRHANREYPVTNETLLLLVLAASAEGTKGVFDGWAEELQLRFPEPEVREWLQTIRP